MWYAFKREGLYFAIRIERGKVTAVRFSPSIGFETGSPRGRYLTYLEKLYRLYRGLPVSPPPFSLRTSPFVRKVLSAVVLIPHGHVSTYGEIARHLDTHPRAVGRALASNPLPLIIPCHRVVKSNFRLGGYSAGFGASTKALILGREVAHRKGIVKNVDGMRVFPAEVVREIREFCKRK